MSGLAASQLLVVEQSPASSTSIRQLNLQCQPGLSLRNCARGVDRVNAGQIVHVVATSEPGTLTLFGLGGLALIYLKRRRVIGLDRLAPRAAACLCFLDLTAVLHDRFAAFGFDRFQWWLWLDRRRWPCGSLRLCALPR